MDPQVMDKRCLCRITDQISVLQDTNKTTKPFSKPLELPRKQFEKLEFALLFGQGFDNCHSPNDRNLPLHSNLAFMIFPKFYMIQIGVLNRVKKITEAKYVT